MRSILSLLLIALAMLAAAAPARAQGGDDQEIVVTGFRALNPDDDDADKQRDAKPPALPSSAVMLRRTADFAVQQVTIEGDSRDEDQRRVEIFAMVKNAIDLAARYDVQLATGELVIEPLTLANYKDLKLVDDEDLTDAEIVTFIVKTPLAPGVDAKTALARIARFIAAVPAVGRAELKAKSELTLSVVNPEQYRRAIIALIAKDAGATVETFGTGYGVDVSGLDRPVQWTRASLTEVLLYLPAAYTVRPRD